MADKKKTTEGSPSKVPWGVRLAATAMKQWWFGAAIMVALAFYAISQGWHGPLVELLSAIPSFFFGATS